MKEELKNELCGLLDSLLKEGTNRLELTTYEPQEDGTLRRVSVNVRVEREDYHYDTHVVILR